MSLATFCIRIYKHRDTRTRRNGFVHSPTTPTPTDARIVAVEHAKMMYDVIGISRPCEAQNITTFAQWLSHYERIFSDFQILQCGFNMTKETEVQNFGVTLEANAFLQRTKFASVNSEVRAEGWDEDNAKVIPIQAFFYFVDSKSGLEHAVKYRDDFYTQSGGEKVPIVGIRLPTKSNPHIYITQDHVPGKGN